MKDADFDQLTTPSVHRVIMSQDFTRIANTSKLCRV